MNYVTKQTQLDALVADLKQAKTVAFDLETQGLDPHVDEPLLLAFAWNGNAAVIRRYGLDLTGIGEVLSSPRILKLIHNAKFEWKMVFARLGFEIKRFYCTMLAEQLCHSGRVRGFGLDDILMRRYGIDVIRSVFSGLSDEEYAAANTKKKDLQLSFVGMPIDAEFSEQQLTYALGDTAYLERLFEDQLKEIRDLELTDLMKLEISLVPVLSRMELEGMPIDTVRWRQRLVELEQQKAALEPDIKNALTPILQDHYRRLFAVAQGNYTRAVKELFLPFLQEYAETVVARKPRKARDEFHAKFGPVLAGEFQLGAVSDLPSTVRNKINRYLKEKADSGSETDKKLLPENVKKLFGKLAELDMAGINLGSVQQVILAYHLRGISLGVDGLEDHERKWDKTARRFKQTTDAFALRGARKAMGNRPNFATLAEATEKFETAKKIEKQLSSFGENMLSLTNPRTGRLHPDFRQYGAETGRLSAVEPAVLTIPNRGEAATYRTFFITVPKQVLVKADYSQFELRAIAQASGDPVMLEAYRKNMDIHSLTASKVVGMTYEEIEALKDTDQVVKDKRTGAKAVNFGIAFDMKKYTLAKRTGMPLDDAEIFIQVWNETYSVAAQSLDDWGNFAVNNGYQKTLGGRIRWFTKPEENDPEFRSKISSIYRAGRNVIPQGTNADVTKTAAVAIAEGCAPYCMRPVGVFPRPNIGDIIAYPYNLVHDEIVVVAPSRHADKVADLVQKEMVKAGEKWIDRVPVIVDVHVGATWGG